MSQYSQTQEQREIEARIRKWTEEVPELSFGYIGNCGYDCGYYIDDRGLKIWVKGLNWAGGNQKTIWSAEARQLTPEDQRIAWTAIKSFRLALELVKQTADQLAAAGE